VLTNEGLKMGPKEMSLMHEVLELYSNLRLGQKIGNGNLGHQGLAPLGKFIMGQLPPV
jgi:hypothetical protein